MNYLVTSDGIFLIKFDEDISKYNFYFDKLSIQNINITDPEIIDFYGIDELPTIYVYKNRTMVNIIHGFYTKTELVKKIFSNN